MAFKKKSLLEEINDSLPFRDRNIILESRANHIVNSAINLLELISENYDEKTSADLKKKFILAIKHEDFKRFKKGLNKLEKK